MKIRLDNSYTAFVALVIISAPILGIYGVYLGESVTLFDVSLATIAIFELIRNRKRKISLIFALFSVSFLFSSTLRALEDPEVALLLKNLRILFYYAFFGILAVNILSVETIYKVGKILCVFSCTFLFYQYFSLFTQNHYPQGTLNFLPLLRNDLADWGSQGYSNWFRPRSIFGEPSQFAFIVGTFTTWEALRKNSNLFLVAFYLVSLIAIFSTLGLLITIFNLFILILFQDNFRKYAIFILPVCVVLIYFMFGEKFSIWEQRFFWSIENRIESVTVNTYVNGFEPGVVDFLLGTGPRFDLYPFWLSGLARFYFYYGVIIFGIFCIILLQNIDLKNLRRFCLQIYLIGLFATTEIVVNGSLVLFLFLYIYVFKAEAQKASDRAMV